MTGSLLRRLLRVPSKMTLSPFDMAIWCAAAVTSLDSSCTCPAFQPLYSGLAGMLRLGSPSLKVSELMLIGPFGTGLSGLFEKYDLPLPPRPPSTYKVGCSPGAGVAAAIWSGEKVPSSCA